MSTSIQVTCDRNQVVIEERTLDDGEPIKREPALVIWVDGKVAVKFQDLCGKCKTTTDNYIASIALVKSKDTAPPVAPVAPVAPNVPRFAMGVWIQDGGNNYSHKSPPQVGEKVITIPALEGVTDPVEAGALISAHNEPPAGGEAGSDQAILQLVVPE